VQSGVGRSNVRSLLKPPSCSRTYCSEFATRSAYLVPRTRCPVGPARDSGWHTKREKFLTEMEQVVPWARWLALTEPHHPKVGLGRRPMRYGQMWPTPAGGDSRLRPFRRVSALRISDRQVPVAAGRA
jgi:hypothetical protein